MAAYQCPKCQSANLTVAVIVHVKLVQHEDNQETEYAGGDHEWDDTSIMTCEDCQHCDAAGSFCSHSIDPKFRVFSNGDVIALWGEPDSRGFVESYMHVGQHGDGAAHLIKELREATPEEAAPLARELRGRGYHF